jgi:hypothetical protein
VGVAVGAARAAAGLRHGSLLLLLLLLLRVALRLARMGGGRGLVVCGEALLPRHQGQRLLQQGRLLRRERQRLMLVRAGRACLRKRTEGAATAAHRPRPAPPAARA